MQDLSHVQKKGVHQWDNLAVTTLYLAHAYGQDSPATFIIVTRSSNLVAEERSNEAFDTSNRVEENDC